MTTTVVVADDAPLIREALAGLLRSGGFRVLAEVGEVPALLSAVEQEPPSVVVLDIRMPPTHRLEGLEAAVTLRRTQPRIGILLLSQHVEVQYLDRLIGTGPGGLGYLLKERAGSVDSFLDSVRTVTGGGCVLDPEVVTAMLAAASGAAAMDALTPRERQVLRLMAEGCSNAAICDRLRMGAKTVESHVRRIFQRLHLPDEPDANRRVLAVLAYLRALESG